MTRPALFLDRDGVINQPPPPEQRYILSPDAFHLMPGIADAIRLCNEHHIPVVAVTNQKCVATGLLTEPALLAIHQRMHTLLAAQNARIDAVYYCPHDESAACPCRKPLPGMILRAAADLNLHLPASWLAGDQPRDILAGRAAGCRTLHLSTHPCPEADTALPDTTRLPHWLQTHFFKEIDCHPFIHAV